MDKFYNRQTELLVYLNDNSVEPTTEILGIAEIFDIEFSDVHQEWDIVKENNSGIDWEQYKVTDFDYT